eukprot:scaffold103213_cov14-Tisochrysis_lutea.AAC.1
MLKLSIDQASQPREAVCSMVLQLPEALFHFASGRELHRVKMTPNLRRKRLASDCDSGSGRGAGARGGGRGAGAASRSGRGPRPKKQPLQPTNGGPAGAEVCVLEECYMLVKKGDARCSAPAKGKFARVAAHQQEVIATLDLLLDMRALASSFLHHDNRVTEEGDAERLSSTSRYRGVTRHKRSGRWEAHIWIKELKKQVYLGRLIMPWMKH